MLSVVCVRWGSKYGPNYVYALRDMVERTLTVPHNFVCLTDQPLEGIECIPLWGNLKGWWNKLLLFSPDLNHFGVIKNRFLFLDLDVVLMHSLDSLVETQNEFVICKDFMKPHMINSSVFLLSKGSRQFIWDRFSPQAANRFWGDQEWIAFQMNQRRMPVCTWPREWVVSYRLECQDGPPPGARVVAFHGQPKPHQLSTDWIKEKTHGRFTNDT